jgi:hypothetical protein
LRNLFPCATTAALRIDTTIWFVDYQNQEVRREVDKWLPLVGDFFAKSRAVSLPATRTTAPPTAAVANTGSLTSFVAARSKTACCGGVLLEFKHV